MAKLDQLKNPGKKTEGESAGKSSEEIADVLGVSTRTAERMRNIINNADDETLEAVKNGEMSISKADKIINEKKNPKPKKEKEDFSDDDISDALEDNEENPAGLNFNHSDGIERPTTKLSPEEDSERTQERRTAYESGFSDGFWKALVFALSEIKKGKTPEEVYSDERVSDLSPQIICKFELPEDAEDIVGRF